MTEKTEKSSPSSILRGALEGTSMKGVPRIIKSETICLRIMWFFTVFVLLAIAITMSTQLVVEFLDFPVTTYVFKGPPHKDSKPMMHFPAITICNKKPFPSFFAPNGFDARTRLENYEDLRSSVLEDFQPDTRHEANIVNYIRSNAGFYHYLGIKRAAQVGHLKETFLQNCTLTFFNQGWYGQSLLVPCSSVADIHVLSCPQNFNCFTINLRKNYQNIQSGIPRELNLVLNIDQDSRKMDRRGSFDPVQTVDQTTGVQVFFSAGNQTVDIEAGGIGIPPGRHATILTDGETRLRLGAPYSKCVGDGWGDLYGLDGLPLSYTWPACWRACTSQLIVEKCGCLQPEYLVVNNQSHLNLPLCLAIPEDGPSDVLFDRMRCLAKLTNSNAHCLEECPYACDEKTYSHTVAYTVWPNKPRILDFYEYFVKTSNTAPKFSEIYDPILEESISGVPDSEIMSKLSKIKLIEENFLKLSFHFDAISQVTTEDRPKITFVDLLSQLGGLLNLYSGITFVLFFEVVEAIVRLGMACITSSIKEAKQNI